MTVIINILERKLYYIGEAYYVVKSCENVVAHVSWVKALFKNKVAINKTIPSSVWRYGLQAYGISAKTHINKFRIAQS